MCSDFDGILVFHKAKLLVYKIYKPFVACEHVLWVVTEDKVHRNECRK